MPRVSDIDKGFRQGVGLMVAWLNREDQGCVIAKEAYHVAGFSAAQYKTAGLDEYDLSEIRRIEKREMRR